MTACFQYFCAGFQGKKFDLIGLHRYRQDLDLGAYERRKREEMIFVPVNSIWASELGSRTTRRSETTSFSSQLQNRPNASHVMMHFPDQRFYFPSNILTLHLYADLVDSTK